MSTILRQQLSSRFLAAADHGRDAHPAVHRTSNSQPSRQRLLNASYPVEVADRVLRKAPAPPADPAVNHMPDRPDNPLQLVQDHPNELVVLALQLDLVAV